MCSVQRLMNYWETTVDQACKELEKAAWSDKTAEKFMEPIVEKPDSEKMRRHALTFFYLASLRRLVLDGRTDHAREVAKRFLQVVPHGKSLRRVERALKGAPEVTAQNSVSLPEGENSSLYENPELDAELGAIPLHR